MKHSRILQELLGWENSQLLSIGISSPGRIQAGVLASVKKLPQLFLYQPVAKLHSSHSRHSDTVTQITVVITELSVMESTGTSGFSDSYGLMTSTSVKYIPG